MPYFVWDMGSCIQHQGANFFKDILATIFLKDILANHVVTTSSKRFRRKGSSRIIPPSNRLKSVIFLKR
jgi:hypothetical protein